MWLFKTPVRGDVAPKCVLEVLAVVPFWSRAIFQPNGPRRDLEMPEKFGELRFGNGLPTFPELGPGPTLKTVQIFHQFLT